MFIGTSTHMMSRKRKYRNRKIRKIWLDMEIGEVSPEDTSKTVSLIAGFHSRCPTYLMMS